MKFRWQWLCGFLFGAVVVIAFGAQQAKVWDLSEPAAFVNDTVINKGELLDRLLADFGEETLKQLITLRLLEQEAEKEGITVPDSEVKQRFEDLKAKREDLSKQLGRGRLSDLTLWDEAKRLVLLEKLIGKRVEVSEKELRDFYKRHFIRYNRPERVQIREIILSTLPEAQEVYRQLIKTPPAKLSEEFERLSRERSVVQGAVGEFTYAELPEEMRLPLQRAQPNEILPPIPVTVSGRLTYRIVWVLDKKPGERNPFEKIRDRVRQDYLVERMVILAPELVEQLWKQAKIKYTVSFEDGTGK
ncbi:MAG: peptidylprolyl isomerase [Candidatus Fervidibacter sp.]|uniref:peptidylprolyl isomerase n=1 Tax=Candidatus Fervidibacter sp. TaxID=3100871 RepID=UPI00404B0EED